jgi:predicted  nucleic acid-binding Zn-ribbon protein
MTVFEKLLIVQESDTSADQLRHRLEHLPESDALNALVDERVAGEAERAATRDARDAVSKLQKRLEDETATIEAKAEHVDQQMVGITSPKEAEALQHELVGMRARQAEHEDLVIEQMEGAEALDSKLAELSALQDTIELKITAATAELEAATEAVNAELSEIEVGRAEQVGEIPPELLELYETMRSQMGGVAVARLTGDLCEGCHLRMPAVDLDVIRHAPVDDVSHCPECNRILVR